MTRTLWSYLLALGLLAPGAGCTLGLGQDSANSEHGEDDVAGDDVGDDDGDRDDCKIEDGDIGVEGVELLVDGVVVTFTDWVTKEGEPGEYVGFTISTSDGEGVDYLVKTGGEVYASSDSTWQHPEGVSGPDVPAISNVEVPCEDPEGDGEGDDGDGDDGDDGEGDDNDDDGCTDVEGCDGSDGDVPQID